MMNHLLSLLVSDSAVEGSFLKAEGGRVLRVAGHGHVAPDLL